MMYDKLPRPVTTPNARERARALLDAAQRRQNLFAQALIQAEAAPVTGLRATTTGVPPDGTSLDRLVQHVTQASDQDLMDTHQRLAQARALAQGHMANDADLAGLVTAAYGPAPGQSANHTHPDVVDVVAHEVKPAMTPAHETGEAGDSPAAIGASSSGAAHRLP